MCRWRCKDCWQPPRASIVGIYIFVFFYRKHQYINIKYTIHFKYSIQLYIFTRIETKDRFAEMQNRFHSENMNNRSSYATKCGMRELCITKVWNIMYLFRINVRLSPYLLRLCASLASQMRENIYIYIYRLSANGVNSFCGLHNNRDIFLCHAIKKKHT